MEFVTILGVPYSVRLVPVISLDELTVGQIDYLKQEILILEGLGDDLFQVTLLHEVLHGIFSQLGFDVENNEHLIQALATALYQVLRENKLFSSCF